MKHSSGFTLIEIMVSMTIFMIIMTGIYQTFHYQQKAFIAQEHVVNMQQEARAGQFFLARDIRMAGFDPTATAEIKVGGNKVTTATAGEFQFWVDDNFDGNYCVDESDNSFSCTNDERERIRMTMKDANGNEDTDGVCDNPPCRLAREYNNGGLQPVAESIERLEFCYELMDGTQTLAPTLTERKEIAAVYVSTLYRTSVRIQNYKNSLTYVPAAADVNLTTDFDGARSAVWGPFNDGFRRRLTVVKHRCRNMGLDPFGDAG